MRARALVLGFAVDAVLGDPVRFHPVAGFGRAAAALERLWWRPHRAGGAVHVALLVGAAAGIGRLAERNIALRAFSVWVVLGGRSLGREALLLADAMERGAVVEARLRAPALVGRDPAGLGVDELSRAAIESVAENTGDAVVAPLLWFAVWGAPGAFAYRAVNTLDAMIGHRSERYLHFGWAAARLDDVAGWPAARLGAWLAVVLAPVVGGTTRDAARVVLRDGGCHPSPNAAQNPSRAGRCWAAAPSAPHSMRPAAHSGSTRRNVDAQRITSPCEGRSLRNARRRTLRQESHAAVKCRERRVL